MTRRPQRARAAAARHRCPLRLAMLVCGAALAPLALLAPLAPLVALAAFAAAPATASGGPADSAEEAPASFDYFYVEANEGGSSGGHAAIRIDDLVYHFENRDGLLVIGREPTRDFLHAYALLGNRAIERFRIALRSEDRDRIEAELDRRHRVEAGQQDVLAALGEDRRLLERWRDTDEDGSPAGPPLAVPALGFFAGFEASKHAEPRSAHGVPDARSARRDVATIDRLRGRIGTRFGERFFAERRAQAVGALEEALQRDPAGWSVRIPRRRGELPLFAHPFARRIGDAAANLAALAVLERRSPLARSALVSLEGPSGWLSAAEQHALEQHRRTLERELVGLVASGRGDWGRPFLVALARLLAADESLERRRLVLLDVLQRDGGRLPWRALAARPDVVAEITRAAADRVEEARASLVLHTIAGAAAARAPGERAWSRLEDDVSRLRELERAVAERRDLRIARGALVPARIGEIAPGALLRPEAGERSRVAAISRAALDANLARVRAREASYRDALERLYRYQLVTRNCVSELFHSVNEALGGSPGSVRAALGGYVDGSASLEFIPFVSARAVASRYRIVRHDRIPSYRELRLREMRERESAFWVALRESNTLTAKSYRRSHVDSLFLFFTDFGDEAFALRPIFGAFNLAAAIGESLWGLVRLPVDGGDTLESGLTGALTSLPELAFSNIRKGSNDWVEPREQSLGE